MRHTDSGIIVIGNMCISITKSIIESFISNCKLKVFFKIITEENYYSIKKYKEYKEIETNLIIKRS